MAQNSDIQINLPSTINPTLQLPDPLLLQIYEDREYRTIWMLDEVGDEAYDWIQFIINCNRDDKDLPIEARKPIKCIIANYGGSLDKAKMVMEVIRLSKTPVYGFAMGMCASAASLIFMSCTKKFAFKNTTFLFHNGSCNNLEGSYNEIQAFMENYNKDIKILGDFYKSHTSYAPEVVDQKLAQGDWYLSTEEARAHCVFDEVIEDLDILL